MLLYLKARDLPAAFVVVDFFWNYWFVWHKCIQLLVVALYKLSYHLQCVTVESPIERCQNDLDTEVFLNCIYYR